MSAPEISHKLERFLDRPIPVQEECHAVYLMVELRKFAEQLRIGNQFPYLYAFGNWVAHPLLDRRSLALEQLAEEIYQYANVEIQAGRVRSGTEYSCAQNFSSLDRLRTEMRALFASMRIRTGIAGPEGWNSFERHLIGVLADQRVEFEQGNVRTMYFEPVTRDCVVEFAAPVSAHFRFRLRSGN